MSRETAWWACRRPGSEAWPGAGRSSLGPRGDTQVLCAVAGRGMGIRPSGPAFTAGTLSETAAKMRPVPRPARTLGASHVRSAWVLPRQLAPTHLPGPHHPPGPGASPSSRTSPERLSWQPQAGAASRVHAAVPGTEGDMHAACVSTCPRRGEPRIRPDPSAATQKLSHSAWAPHTAHLEQPHSLPTGQGDPRAGRGKARAPTRCLASPAPPRPHRE